MSLFLNREWEGLELGRSESQETSINPVIPSSGGRQGYFFCVYLNKYCRWDAVELFIGFIRQAKKDGSAHRIICAALTFTVIMRFRFD